MAENIVEKAPVIKVVITVDGEEKLNAELDSICMVGVHKDGVSGDSVSSCGVVTGLFDMPRAAAIINTMESFYKRYPQFALAKMMVARGAIKSGSEDVVGSIIGK